jgi:GGDEF domain-containing protein
MLLNGWSITFSVGVVTFLEVPETVDDMVRLADAAMYEIKSTSKSGMSFHIQGQPPA